MEKWTKADTATTHKIPIRDYTKSGSTILVLTVSVSEENTCILQEPKGSLLCSQGPAMLIIPSQFNTFHALPPSLQLNQWSRHSSHTFLSLGTNTDVIKPCLPTQSPTPTPSTKLLFFLK
jgi:hypothetical protein